MKSLGLSVRTVYAEEFVFSHVMTPITRVLSSRSSESQLTSPRLCMLL